MKKQFQILAATFITVAFISCSREKVEMPDAPATNNEEIPTSSASNRPYIDPLIVGLDGSYSFDKHLKDVTRQLPDGKPSFATRGAVIYTTDRKGKPNAALKFDGNYYVSIENVPVQQHMSLSVWVKRTATYPSTEAPPIIRHTSTGIGVMQDEDAFWGRVLCYTSTGSTSVYSDDFSDAAWHHIVVTYAADEMAIYVDGQLQSKTGYGVFTVTDVMTKYLLGYGFDLNGYWKGIIDDLRFYSRTLSASDVQKLYNL
jgi:hypothetical protein